MASNCNVSGDEEIAGAEDNLGESTGNAKRELSYKLSTHYIGGRRLKSFGERCKKLLAGRKDFNGSDCSTRDRRSRLAEDALFYDDMLEVAHLHGHVLEDSAGAAASTRVRKRFTTPSSSPTSCVCVKYTKNSQDEPKSGVLSSTSSQEPMSMGARLKKKLSGTFCASHFSAPSRSKKTKGRSRELKRAELASDAIDDDDDDSLEGSSPPLGSNHKSRSALSVSQSSSQASQRMDVFSFCPIDISAAFSSLSINLSRPTIHSQVDYTNFLIPGQEEIVNCPFYWGKIDRYEAEELLSDKPEGSFLLRDSAQDDFVFSVSFRRYSRSLHARIEEDNHLFSFDSHDPGVHSSASVRELLGHYKDPLSCMFFEPMLLFPVARKTCFSLQSLARATVCDHTTYSGVLQLPMPKVLKQYLREYHYKHKLRTRYLETVS